MFGYAGNGDSLISLEQYLMCMVRSPSPPLPLSPAPPLLKTAADVADELRAAGGAESDGFGSLERVLLPKAGEFIDEYWLRENSLPKDSL